MQHISSQKTGLSTFIWKYDDRKTNTLHPPIYERLHSHYTFIPPQEGRIMAACPWCGSDLFGYSQSLSEKNMKGRKVTGVACCPWCKWSDTGEKYLYLDDDEVKIPY
jgi:hypothetical protein